MDFTGGLGLGSGLLVRGLLNLWKKNGEGLYGDPYGEGPYGDDPYGDDPYGGGPYGGGLYGGYPYGGGPYGGGRYGGYPYGRRLFRLPDPIKAKIRRDTPITFTILTALLCIFEAYLKIFKISKL